MLKHTAKISFVLVLYSCQNTDTIPFDNTSGIDTVKVIYWLFKDSRDNGITLKMDTLVNQSMVMFSTETKIRKQDLDEKLSSVKVYGDSLSSSVFDISDSKFKLISIKEIIGPDKPYVFYNLFVVTNGLPSSAIYSPEIGLVMDYSAHFYSYLIMSQTRYADFVEDVNYNWYVNDLFDTNFVKLNLESL